MTTTLPSAVPQAADAAGSDAAPGPAPGPTPGTGPAGPPAHRRLRARTLGRLAVRRVAGVRVSSWLALYGVLAFGLCLFARYGMHFYPDSRYYIAMALRDLGMSVPEAFDVTGHIWKGRFEPWYFSGDDTLWNLVQPRMLYPLLSAPFVAVLGAHWGMLVVPALSLAYFTYAMTTLITRLYGEALAVVCVGTFLLSSTLYVWSAAGMTEGLTLALLTLLVVNLPLAGRPRPYQVVLVGLAVVLLALTRQIGPVPAGIVGAGWLWETIRRRRLRNEWLPYLLVVGVLTVLVQAVMSWFAPFDLARQFVATSGKATLGEALATLPELVRRMVEAEVLSLHGDRIMLAFLVIAVIHGVLWVGRTTSALLIGSAVPTFLLTVGNGVPSQMRYEVTLYPVMVLAAAAALAALPVFARPRVPGHVVTAPARPERPARDRAAVPVAVGSLAFVTLVVGWGATHGSASTAPVPPGPPDAAAMVASGENLRIIARPPAEFTIAKTLRVVRQFESGAQPKYGWWEPIEVRHPFRYAPRSPADPGWDRREGADGTAVVTPGDLNGGQSERWMNALTRDATIVPDSVTVVRRTVSASGEEVDFEARDAAGTLHQGHAVTLYRTRNVRWGTLTALVWQR